MRTPGAEQGMECRLASPGDAATAARLLHDFNTEFASPTPNVDVLTRRFGALLARPDFFVVLAEGPGEAAGFALITLRPTPYYDGSFAQLEELYVAPALRGAGIGTGLLTYAVREAVARGAGEMHINVDEVDTDARRFYETHGFRNVEAGTDYRMLCYLREFEGTT